MEQAPVRDITQAGTREGVSVSVEAVVWMALVAAAVGVRLAALGEAEFSIAESRRAVDALSVASGTTPEAWTGDAAAAAMSYLFGGGAESEALARLPSALGGSLLVAGLWFTRPFAGGVGALAAAVLLAFSPLFVFFSRSAEPFGMGAAAGVLCAVSLLAYLRDPGPGWLFSFTVFAGLAALTDAVAVAAVIAISLFAGFEALLVGNAEVQRAWSSFRSSPLQWAVVALVMGATLMLGLTHFGTSTEKIGLAGLAQFGEMFELPRDSRPAGYHPALLLAYDWPLMAAGIGGFVALTWQAIRRGLRSLSPFERLGVVWTLTGAMVLTFVTQREAGQTLILLLPIALVGGSLAERVSKRANWTESGRWWPAAAVATLLAGGFALAMTEWSGGAANGQRILMLLFAAAAGLVVAGALATGRVRALGPVAAAVALIGGAYAAHSSLAVAFDSGPELARDERLLERREEFREILDRLATEREGLVVIDPELRDVLAWTLRDSPYVFGGDPEAASVYVGRADSPPNAFRTVGGEWTVSEQWYPEDVLKPRSMWRWLLYREPYGPVETTVVQIYVPTI